MVALPKALIGMMNKCITGKNVYDTVNALLIISTYDKIDKQLWGQYLQNLPDIMAVYSLRFSASAIAVTVVMTIINKHYCRLQDQIRPLHSNIQNTITHLINNNMSDIKDRKRQHDRGPKNNFLTTHANRAKKKQRCRLIFDKQR